MIALFAGRKGSTRIAALRDQTCSGEVGAKPRAILRADGLIGRGEGTHAGVVALEGAPHVERIFEQRRGEDIRADQREARALAAQR